VRCQARVFFFFSFFFTIFSSNGCLITQCEAEGFRNITYYIDRPDVMASFTTTLVGDAQQFPVMLANGDLLESNVVNGQRYCVYHCPHRIPAYLFALVAGDFARVSDAHTRPDGRPVSLNIYVPHGCESKTTVAMRALKDCMLFDEHEYGRVCDVNQV
jgi:aminopeptidase N